MSELKSKGRIPDSYRFDKLVAREACQSFENCYNSLEELILNYNVQDAKDNFSKIAFLIGKLGSHYSRIVEKMKIYD